MKRRHGVVYVIDRAAREERVEESIIYGRRVVTGCYRAHSCLLRLEASRKHHSWFEGRRKKQCWTGRCSCNNSRWHGVTGIRTSGVMQRPVHVTTTYEKSWLSRRERARTRTTAVLSNGETQHPFFVQSLGRHSLHVCDSMLAAEGESPYPCQDYPPQ